MWKDIISPPRCLTLCAERGFEFSHTSAVWEQPHRHGEHLSRDAEFSLLFTRRVHT